MVEQLAQGHAVSLWRYQMNPDLKQQNQTLLYTIRQITHFSKSKVIVLWNTDFNYTFS